MLQAQQGIIHPASGLTRATNRWKTSTIFYKFKEGPMVRWRGKRIFTLWLTSLMFASLFLLRAMADASPVMNESGYSIQLITTGIGASTGIAIGPSGDIFVADDDGGRIYRVDASTHQVGTYASIGLSFCSDVAFDPSGNLYVGSGSDPKNILRVISDGNYSTIATGSYTVGITFSQNGSLYMANSGDGTITKVTSGVKTTFLSGYGNGNGFGNGPFGLAFDGAENLYFVQKGTGEIWKSNSTGTIVSKIAQLSSFGPSFIAIDSLGNVYVSEPSTASIWKISNGQKTIFASGFAGNSDPPFIGPNGLEFDTHGNLYVADATNLWMITSDVIPPTVTSTNPIPNATGISINSSLNATFSVLMDASTIVGATFFLTGGGGGISGSISTANVSGTTVATLIPSAPLSYGATYTATITTGVKDVAGNAMSANYTWSFTTQNAPDTTPPPTTGGGGGGGGCSISPEGSSKGESPLGTLLALLSPGILLIGRRVIRQVQNWI
jgi:sugar lactone lactonase YvrE